MRINFGLFGPYNDFVVVNTIKCMFCAKFVLYQVTFLLRLYNVI